MTTAAERKAKREKRLAKEEKTRKFLAVIRRGIRYFGAGVGFAAAAMWLAVVMWDYPEWALTISWGCFSLVIGAILLQKAAK